VATDIKSGANWGRFANMDVVSIHESLSVRVSSNGATHVVLTLTGRGAHKNGDKLKVEDARIRFWLRDLDGRLVDPDSGNPYAPDMNARHLTSAFYYRESSMPAGYQPISLSGIARIPRGEYVISVGYYSKSDDMRFRSMSLEALVIDGLPPAAAQ